MLPGCLLPPGVTFGLLQLRCPHGKKPQTVGVSGQPPVRHEGTKPGEELMQSCTSPWPARRRSLLCSLSTLPRDSIREQAWVLGEVKVLPSELCGGTGRAEPPPWRAPVWGCQHTSVCLSACAGTGGGGLYSKILVKGAARVGLGSFPSHSVPGPCGRPGCELDPFTSPNVIIPLGWGVGAGLKGGAMPTLGRQVSGSGCQDSLGLGGPTMGAGSESSLAGARPH